MVNMDRTLDLLTMVHPGIMRLVNFLIMITKESPTQTVPSWQLEKGVEIGAGFSVVTQRGSEHRDEIDESGFKQNNSGGTLGGISSGQDIISSIALKPTSSIIKAAETIDKEGTKTEIVTKGRHDPCVGLRATPIAEAMLAIVLMDHFLCHRAQNADVKI